eukprot:s2218_g3.t1
MLSILSKNPVFAANPECLASFVESLVQPRPQSIPTPMTQAMAPSTVVKREGSAVEDSQASTVVKREDSQASTVVKRESSAVQDSQASTAAAQKEDGGADSQATIEARKQFWSKFKRLRPADPHFSPEPPSPAPTAVASPAETDYGGVRNPAVRKERQQLFEEFVQSNEDWAQSSMAISSQHRDGQQTRGEELGEWEWNPDVPNMKLFRCWDSSTIISKTEQFRNVTVTKEGELAGQQAAALMPEAIRTAAIADLASNLEALKKGRQELEACVARGGDDTDLTANTQTLVRAISNYKAASKTVKGLEAQGKPKAAKGKAKAAAKPEP